MRDDGFWVFWRMEVAIDSTSVFRAAILCSFDKGFRGLNFLKFLPVIFIAFKTLPIVGCAMQAKTAKLFMWARHRKFWFIG